MIRRQMSRDEMVLAADLGGTKIAVAAVDARGKIRTRTTEPVDTASPAAPVDQIVRLARGSNVAFNAMGVAVPGLVRRDGTVWAPNLPGWDAVPLGKLLRRKLKVPVVVESDRNAAVIGEAWKGAARGRDDVIVLIVGTGIGAGILSGGRIVRGAHELSGCAGWMVVTQEDNEWMRKSGTLEALAAGPAIARAAKRKGTTAEELAAAARAGDAAARELFRSAGRHLGAAVANLISLFDPEMIVIAGGLAAAADLYLEELKRVAMSRAQPLSAPQVEIVAGAMGDANLLGCARLALELSSQSRTRSQR